MAKLHAMLQPFAETSGDPFDATKAAHLLNRAGFGGTPEEIDHVRSLGPQRAVEWLMDFPDANADEQSRKDVPNLASIEGYPPAFAEMRMQLVGKSPEERKAL